MKIKFTKLPTSGGKIQISFDGGQSFTDYNVTDVRESGIPLDDEQDFDKVQIKSNSETLKNLDVITSLKLENSDSSSSGNISFDLSQSKEFPTCVTSIELPDGITSIARGVFHSFKNLESPTIPDTVSSIGEYSFSDDLDYIQYKSGKKALYKANISNDTTFEINSDTIIICDSAFKYKSKLSSITIPRGVLYIGNYAFESCYELSNVNVPNSVISIGKYAFANCRSLTSITIPNSIATIDDYTFQGCSNLETVNIPNSITSIGAWAFNICPKLTNLTLPEGLISIKRQAFNNSGLTGKIIIPDSVMSIGESGFANCPNITSIEISNSITSIEGGCFSGCTSLTSVIIPEKVEKLEINAFQYCKSLESIFIPKSVTSISKGAFRKCSNLGTINYNGTHEEWDLILKEDGWDEDCPSDMVINYNYKG